MESRDQFFDKLWTVKDVANFLSFPVKSIYNFVHAKKIPYIKIGSCLRFSPTEIQKWLSEKGGY